MCSRALRKLADLIAKPLSMISENGSQVSGVWKKGNIIPIFQKGEKDDPRNYQSVSIISVPGKIMDQILLKAMLRHVEDREVIGENQYGSTKGKSCLDFSIGLL